ncbi:enoyl-CoA hydratase/isomerase family protein [Ferrimonas sp. SCSIO 43195]|uniref:enoyl-CoA hydratase/isomerase family protein n=1 Tax=Ferrimonas sp. SCSIO 43195 TaxID=2822844 RepID=UPI0020761688|nr:enoyl-CoA hydratase/isomerase family protein [Ferrimonas sp. SCSIO 43195]USD35726.1 enoyl-CoA hydratase/isomerase family protein [Ferrimonas sp. SCSIO 43195]
MASNQQAVRTRLAQGVLQLTLNRPECGNAMNLAMVSELRQALHSVRDDRQCRAIVIQGQGDHFCAGGDLKEMAAAGQRGANGDDQATFERLNRAYGQLLMELNQAPQFILVLTHGGVLGGGLGLVCVSDLTIAHQNSRLGMPETSLGIPPAQIAPFVVDRIGLTRARPLALLARRIEASAALAMGLVQQLAVDDDDLIQQRNHILAELNRCAPAANAVTKALLLNADQLPRKPLLDLGARQFAAAVCGHEGREGTQAFTQKRRPRWADEPLEV